jgi:hypothetical protein
VWHSDRRLPSIELQGGTKDGTASLARATAAHQNSRFIGRFHALRRVREVMFTKPLLYR